MLFQPDRFGSTQLIWSPGKAATRVPGEGLKLVISGRDARSKQGKQREKTRTQVKMRMITLQKLCENPEQATCQAVVM